jgi:hypothetical protein
MRFPRPALILPPIAIVAVMLSIPMAAGCRWWTTGGEEIDR